MTPYQKGDPPETRYEWLACYAGSARASGFRLGIAAAANRLREISSGLFVEHRDGSAKKLRDIADEISEIETIASPYHEYIDYALKALKADDTPELMPQDDEDES